MKKVKFQLQKVHNFLFYMKIKCEIKCCLPKEFLKLV